MLLQAAWLIYGRKKTATFTLRCKMRLAISRASSWLKYQLNRNGVSFAKLYLAGQKCSFRFASGSGRKLKIAQPPIITVIGKAFFDIGHAPADHSNRRTDLQGYAAWEIHPVMRLHAH
jgi:hypothetical protein